MQTVMPLIVLAVNFIFIVSSFLCNKVPLSFNGQGVSDQDKSVSFFLYTQLMLGFLLSSINKTEINTTYDRDNDDLLGSENPMYIDLTKYLSDVFRNEVQGCANLKSINNEMQASRELVDPKIDQFVLDKRFSLRLDEII
jgi:hypothetical protein